MSSAHTCQVMIPAGASTAVGGFCQGTSFNVTKTSFTFVDGSPRFAVLLPVGEACVARCGSQGARVFYVDGWCSSDPTKVLVNDRLTVRFLFQNRRSIGVIRFRIYTGARYGLRPRIRAGNRATGSNRSKMAPKPI